MEEKIDNTSFIFEKRVWNVKNLYDSNNFDSPQRCTCYLLNIYDRISFRHTENDICDEAKYHDNIDKIVNSF